MTAQDGLPPLRDVIATHGLQAMKALGQNFLLDLNLTGRIARAAGPLEDVTVIEVGPGPGGLTRALLAEGAKKVVAIERDRRCLDALAEIAAHYPGRLEVIEGDAMQVDMSKLATGRVRIAANLPYNIATPLLLGWLQSEPWPPFYEKMTLMFQREVAERIVATNADDAYGRLGVMCGWRSEARILFDISPKAFTPPPKVVSSVVELVPRQTPLACERAKLERVTAAAFGQRRKMLRQSLKSLGTDPLPLLAAAGIVETARAEEIDVARFVRLANALP
ncbi:ribosomal RNA small subunit methyltransferase A [Kaistia sp. 32K]|uniref:16S rRNA (adenine(1518)-N(6)/adenine(1519)-N(6))- dimethyltransferase RsmA n=1 Tax=Kaistia sp. 32K TaxID=2795690 RepID=UPI0019154CBF|nr:16S rRNA (adenine(1518)-N(6)/adenine(1519)-N(6))-dimethyltransferase RsmA [Kaistia sp. 32K]BCP52933.1 ribosomal RNA small subunit methyltransferase A [Kaistia sp. 32K]